jgi:hypothetical protein
VKKKALSSAFITVIIISGLILVSTVHFGAAQTGLITFINSDTTWTKANSPYTLSGSIVVSTGVTLTIDTGVTVNINGYYLFVNGTLRAVGSTSDNIRIFGGDITYGSSASVDSTFENAVINSTISSSQPLTMNNNIINSEITVGSNSVITNNIIHNGTKTGNSSKLLNNNISGDISVGDFCTISDNTIVGDMTTGSSAKISNNKISGGKIYYMAFGGHGYTTALIVSNSSEISNNNISGGVSATSSIISNNTISGGAPFTDWAGRPEDSTSAVTVTGNSSITSNAIYSSTGGYGILIRTGYTYVSGNNIQNGVRIAGDALIETNVISNGQIRIGEIFISAFNDIDYGHGNSIIRSNIITGNYIGIGSTQAGGTATIEQNLISNNTYGVLVNSQVTIQNNTITKSSVAIELDNVAPKIAYNNIMDYTQNSIYLSSNPSAVDATYNWWGTTDTQAINLTIHDFKYDLNLGAVSFVPFLNSLNPQAPSTSYTLQVPTLQLPTPTPTPSATPTSTPTSTPAQSPSSPPPSQNPTASSAIPQIGLNEIEVAILTVLIVIAALLIVAIALMLKKRR